MSTTSSEITESVIDGVRVLHGPADDDVCEATLVFGVGERDEPITARGVLHVLEHLVMHRARVTSARINASVDSSITQFVATGAPERVAEFLRIICEALQNPPLERFADEVRVLDREMADEGADPIAFLHRTRYGFRDLGVRDAPAAKRASLNQDAVVAAARTWFTAENAVLLVAGPLPRLSLPLPSGPRPVSPRPHPRTLAGPGFVVVDAPICLASVLLPPNGGNGADLVAAAAIETQVAEVVRHQLGLTYAVDVELTPIGDRWIDLVVSIEPGPEGTIEASRTCAAVVRRILADGIDDAHWRLAQERVRDEQRGREAALHRALSDAVDTLLGFDGGLEMARLESLGRGEFNAYLRRSAPSLLLLVDERARSALISDGLTEIGPAELYTSAIPSGAVFRPPLFARALFKDARQARVTLTRDAIYTEDADGISRAGFDEIVAVARLGEDALAMAGDGTAVMVGPGVYARGERLRDALLAAVSPSLVYEAYDDDDTPAD